MFLNCNGDDNEIKWHADAADDANNEKLNGMNLRQFEFEFDKFC